MSDDKKGNSYETAIVVEGRFSSILLREHQWINENYGEWRFKSQYLCSKEDKTFDVFTIILTDNSEIKVFFDVTKPFKKEYKKVKT